jgi:hypothetical protein
VKTLAHAHQLLRKNQPDWLLLKRGDVWADEPLGADVAKGKQVNWQWTRFGPSAREPLVIAAYGDEDAARPLIVAAPGINITSAEPVGNMAIVGINFESPGGGYGIRWIGSGGNLLIEDCRIAGYHQNVVVQTRGDVPIADVRLRRNIIVDAHGGRAQGLYAQFVDRLLLEENVFDHNGWRRDDPDAPPTMFNHNVYTKSLLHGVFRGNIFARASSFGATASADNTRQPVRDFLMEDNLFLANGNTFTHGAGANHAIQRSTIRRNVFTQTGRTLGEEPQSFGLDVGSGRDVLVEGNLFIHKPAHGTSFGVRLKSPQDHAVLRGNTFLGWHGPCVQLAGRAGGFEGVVLDSNRFAPTTGEVAFSQSDTGGRPVQAAGQNVLLTYQGAHLGNAGGDVPRGVIVEIADFKLADPQRTVAGYCEQARSKPDWRALLDAARRRRARTWPAELTAGAVNDWLRDGYVAAGPSAARGDHEADSTGPALEPMHIKAP